MRTALILATLVGISAVAVADDLPSLHQCKSGWKSKYRAIWKRSDFDKACSEILKNEKPGDAK
jgi:hypothetical protein